MRMFIYHLEMTDEGSRVSPLYECNYAFVVVAANSKQARTIASEKSIDESPGTWTNGRYSTCRRIGEVTDGAKRTARVVCKEDNAS